MRSLEDKGCCNYEATMTTQDISTVNACSFEFHKGNGENRASRHHRMALGKPTPSKWDDAQKWLVGLSRKGVDRHHHQPKTKPRNSNADDTRLITPVSQMEKHYCGGEDEEVDEGAGNRCLDSAFTIQNEVKTKNVDFEESFWRISKPAVEESTMAMRSIRLRDMGTEMTPIASQDPSRTATPIRATTPAARSPMSSGSSTPVWCLHGAVKDCQTTGLTSVEGRGGKAASSGNKQCNGVGGEESGVCKTNENNKASEQGCGKLSPLESRAIAWDEAERAKYMARYKREEVKIQAWENHEKWKAEMEMRRMEAKAERLKSRAQERCENKLAATQRVAEERRASAETKLNEKAVRTSQRADYIRRTGRLPSSFSFKLPSFCW